LDGYTSALSRRPTISSSASTRARAAAGFAPATRSGSATFSATVLADNRLKCWKIMPIRRRRPTSASSSRLPTSTPSTRTRPALGRSSMLIERSSVDLPAPLRPMMPKTSPRAIENDTSDSATTGPAGP